MSTAPSTKNVPTPRFFKNDSQDKNNIFEFAGNQGFDDQISHNWQDNLMAQLAKDFECRKKDVSSNPTKTHEVFHVFLTISQQNGSKFKHVIFILRPPSDARGSF